VTYSTVTPAKKSTPPLLRQAHLMAFVDYLRKRGAPVDRYLYCNGLPLLCNDQNAFVPLLRVWSFFDTAARHEDSELGWLVGAHAGDHNLNAGLLRQLETAPTLLQALRKLVRMASAEATDVDIGIHERLNDVLLYTHYPGMGEIPGYMISQTYQLGVFLGLIRHFLGRHWVPDEIGVESRLVPPMAEKDFHGCRIMTQRPAGYIAVPRSCLHRAVPPGDAKVSRAENPLLFENPPVPTNNFHYLDMLRAVLKSYLSEGYPSQRVAAELMGTSVRTLTRKLCASGLTYGMLIDELRFNTAKELLQKSNMRIGDIAYNVGFNDQGDFSRMIRRLCGLTPSELRKVTGSKVERFATS
jgi:AraC-like DNA-binding protein